MNYGQLKELVASYVPLAEGSVIGQAVNQAVEDIQDMWTFHCQMHENSWTASAGVKRYARETVAPRMIMPIALYHESSAGKRYFTLRHARADRYLEDDSSASSYRANYKGVGWYYYLTPTEVRLVTAPAENTEMTFLYYRKLPELVNDSDTNWFTDRASELVHLGACLRLEMFNFHDARAAMWKQRFDEKFFYLKAKDIEAARYNAEWNFPPRAELVR